MTLKIMIVDDEAAAAAVLTESLERLAFEVSAWVTDGAEAVKRAELDLPTLILVDIALSGPVDGIEAARLIRAKLKIPVIFLATADDEELIARANLAEPFGYLIKPYHDIQLKPIIEMALARAEAEAGRKRTEEALKKSEEHFRSFVENASDIIFSLSLDGVITYVSPNLKDLLDLERSVFIGRPFTELIHPDDVQDCVKIFRLIMSTGERQRQLEFRVRARDGQWHWFASSGAPVRDDDGTIFSYMGIAREITERKRLEEQLRESETMYRLVVTAMSEGVVFQSANGAITAVNPAAERIQGRTAEQMIGRASDAHCWQAVYEDGTSFPGAFHPSMVTLRTGRPQSNVVMGIHRPDGTLAWISINSQPLIYAGESKPYAVVTTFRDITEHKKAEEELRASEERFRTVANFTYDWETWRGPDGAYIYISPSCERITGYSQEEFLKNPWLSLEIVLDEDRAALNEHFQAEFDHQGVKGLDFRLRTRDGRIRWISHICQPVYSATGQWMGRRCNNRDITNRKMIEGQLKASYDRYRTLIQGLPVGIMSVDADFRITEWNSMAEDITGYREGEVLMRPCSEIMWCEGQANQCPIRMAIDHNESQAQMEFFIRGKDGRSIPVRLRAASLYDHQGQIIGGVEIFQDVSDVRAFERERANLISMLVHDMKSPLVSIQGFARRLIERTTEPTTEKSRRYLEIVLKEAGQLEDLIKDFLEFSRLKDGHISLNLAPTDLKVHILDLVETLQPRFAQAGVRLKVVLSRKIPLIQLDARRLRRVITNLLENALKHSPAGTTVTVTTYLQEHEVRIMVSDQGPGISQEDIRFIFEPFYRGRGGQGYKGYGLGLAGVQAIIKGHGGRVHVENHPEGGSVFIVALPDSLLEGQPPINDL